MKIIIVGYGYYALGDDELSGGTILPALSKWIKLSQNNFIDIVCLTRNKISKKLAEKRFSSFIEKFNLNKKIKFTCKTYDELKKDQVFSCAIVSIPEKYHLECIKYLSSYTKEIICVKPLTESSNQVEELMRFSKKESLNIYIDFHKRFDQSNIEFINNASKKLCNKGVFYFSYGQKEIVPKYYFKKWAHYSNPFQYLAPHYLDIIFKILGNQEFDFDKISLDGSINKLKFDDNPELISFVSCNLNISDGIKNFIISATCNWMEPKSTPFNSRQRIEFQAPGIHLISEQDNRGQLVIDDETIKTPNPHFMTTDPLLFASGYGIDSYCNFLEYICNRFPKDALVSIDNYQPVAKVIDFVNYQLNN